MLVRSRAGVVAPTQGKALYDSALRITRDLAGAVEQLGGRMIGKQGRPLRVGRLVA